MNGLAAVAVTICAVSLVCALLSHFVTDGSTQKILGLVMGAFAVCSMLMPVKNAVENFSVDISGYPSAENLTASADEAYDSHIVAQTEENLGLAAKDILAQNGIEINRAEFVLALTDENRIIIASSSIYISEDGGADEDEVVRLISQNFGITPNIITE